jgi:hypothetical protein
MIKGVVLLSCGRDSKLGSMRVRPLVQRIKAIGLETFDSPYYRNQAREIDAIIKRVPWGIPIASGGVYLDKDDGPDVAQRANRAIRYLFGFQCSTYGFKVGVPDNVEFADNIHKPSWFGNNWSRNTPRPDDEKTGRLRNIPLSDWWVAQDIVFSRVHRLLFPQSSTLELDHDEANLRHRLQGSR